MQKHVPSSGGVEEKITQDEIGDIHTTLGKAVAVALVNQEPLLCIAPELRTIDGVDVDLKAGLELDLGDAGGAAKPEEHELLHLILHRELLMLGVQCRAALGQLRIHVECEVIGKAAEV